MKCLLKNWKIGAYFGSIVLAVGIGMVSTTAREGGVGGTPVGCTYLGYKDVPCSSMYTACTSGTFFAANSNSDGSNGIYKNTGSTVAIGSCSGTVQCTTPYTYLLTSDGCGG
jgi:hypothetical protein